MKNSVPDFVAVEMAAVVVTSQPHPEGADVGGGWHERNDATNNHVTHQHISHAASLPLVGFIGNDKFGDQVSSETPDK